MDTVIYFDEIDSTNNYLKQKHDQYPTQTVIRSDFQTSGRGQFDRAWVSKKGENLLFSILFKEELGFPIEKMNTVIVATLLSMLKEQGINATFKEPNDIYIEGKKCAGILIETKYNEKNLTYLVLGVGLNVNQTHFQELQATSMKLTTNQTFDVDALLKRILSILKTNLFLMRLLYEEKFE